AVLDIAARRVAWDRFVSRQFGADLAREAREAVRDRGAQAARTVGALRTRAATGDSDQAGAPVLSEGDAQALARAAADRRRAQRLAEIHALRAGGSAPAAGEREGEAERSGEGFAAAKRRARERFEEEGR